MFMRIAQIAPPYESVPPKKYGGTERIVSALTEELVKRGHDVTLFASGDSSTSARLISTFSRGIREEFPHDMNPFDDAQRTMAFVQHLVKVYKMAGQFDIIHDHTTLRSLPLGLAFGQYSKVPVISTLHGVLSENNIKNYENLNRAYLVAISESQKRPAPDLNYIATVYNGLDMAKYPFCDKPGDYLLHVGRISHLKGVHHAISIAKKLGLPLIIAAKLDEIDKPYYEEKVKPFIDGRQIRWVGEVSEDERNILMANALCFMHSLEWEEPFGLTLIESMATGTPVAAFNHGSMPEIIQQGKTGWIADSEDELAELIKNNAYSINRHYCRSYALRKFSAKRMVNDYEMIYESIVGAEQFPTLWYRRHQVKQLNLSDNN